MREIVIHEPTEISLPTVECLQCGFAWRPRDIFNSRCPRCHAVHHAAAPPAPGSSKPSRDHAAETIEAPANTTEARGNEARELEAARRFPAPLCALCDDAGLTVTTDEHGNRFAQDCTCRIAQRTARTLAQARIPRRYVACSLDSFNYSRSESIGHAYGIAHRFALAFPFDTAGKGLLFTGTPGLGKTHLAVSILHHAITTGTAQTGFFYEHKELLERLRSFYDLRSAGAENTLLRTLITCDLLILDDLGEITPSEWAWDTTAYILNARYNENRSTLITTNRPNEPALASRPGEESSQLADARIAYKRETLGDRIGDRMRSRLLEMCVSLHLHGAPDYRETARRASFAP